MASSNPLFKTSRLHGAMVALRAAQGADAGVMTVQGAALKTFALIALVMASAGYTWFQAQHGRAGEVEASSLVAMLLALVVAIVTCVAPRVSPWTAPVYAVLEGVALGGLSFLLSARYADLPLQAVTLTFGVALVMLALYVTRVLRATPPMWRVVGTATLGILAAYLVQLVLALCGITIAAPWANGPVGLVIQLAITGVAAFNLILDFGVIEESVAAGAPRAFEWYGAFGVVVTLAWLYLRMLRLLRRR